MGGVNPFSEARLEVLPLTGIYGDVVHFIALIGRRVGVTEKNSIPLRKAVERMI